MNIQGMFAASQAVRSPRWEDVNAFIDDVGHESIFPNSDSALLDEDAAAVILQKPEKPVDTSPQANALYQDCVLAISQNGSCDVPDALMTKNESRLLKSGSDEIAKLQDNLVTNSTPMVGTNALPDKDTSKKIVTPKRSLPKTGVHRKTPKSSKIAKKLFKCPEPDCGKVSRIRKSHSPSLHSFNTCANLRVFPLSLLQLHRRLKGGTTSKSIPVRITKQNTL